MKHKKKLLSLLLSFAMVIQIVVPVSAQATVAPGINSVCTHHTEHKVNGDEADREDPLGGTEGCGYKQGAPCTHEHKANDGEADSEGPLGSTEGCYTKTESCKHTHDETCGYTPDSPCTFDVASCTECNTSNKPLEKVCTCPPVDSGEQIHNKDCPSYTAPEPSEAVKALIEMVGALLNADTITGDSSETVKADFDAALAAYKALSMDEKATFDATEYYKKLMNLLDTLYGDNRMNWSSNRFDPADFPYTGEMPSKDEVSALLQQMYQRGNISPMTDDELLETIEVDKSRIIHRPADYLPTPELVRGNAPATYGLIESDQSGPFAESDERYFRLEVSGKGGNNAYRAVKSRLIATGNNTNIWVADDDDFHAKTGTTHDPRTCNLESVTYAMAKDLATGFDGIYSRMTADFGSFELYETPFSNMSKFGDLGDDGHVNILLYDIDALDTGGSSYVLGYFWNLDMYDANQMMGDSEVIHPIDMFHVDIGTDQGWKSISGNENDKLELYGTLAHEFQHMLFFTHFGVYPNENFPSHFYTWFNESLSGLADVYYVQPGAEIMDFSYTMFAASNPYDGTGYGDLFLFNGSMKNYGMGYFFSTLFHNYTGGTYARGVYDYFDSLGTDTTIDGFNAKYDAVNNNINFDHPFNHVGAMLNSGLGLGQADEQSLVALMTAYQYFMESFASDGGLNAGAGMPTQKLLRGTTDRHNLWHLRPLLGQEILSGSQELPTLASGDKIIIDASGNYPNVTRDMMYKLEGDGAAIEITVAPLADDKFVYFYLALANPNSATGADIYPLTPDVPSRIVTNGRTAYFFVDTFLTAISDTDDLTVDYTWHDIGAGELDGTAEIDNITPRIGETLTGRYTGTDIAPENVAYAWYVGIEEFSSGADATYTVETDDLGQQITLIINDVNTSTGPFAQAVTVAVKKNSYIGLPAKKPTVEAFTQNSVRLSTVADMEYSNGGAIWQDSTTFNGLSPDVTYTFYCRVKETDEMEASERSEGTQVKTNVGTVSTPSISTQPVGATYKYGSAIQPLTIVASDSDGAKLSYLWYKNDTNSTTGGSLVANTTAASYTPTAKDAGTVYYYCVVSKTVEGQTKTTTSDIAAVKIEPLLITGTLSVTNVSKAYDGNTNIVGTAPTITFEGALTGETPTATATFAYDNATAGTGKIVNATNITLIAGNSINANYTLAKTTASGTGAEISAIHPTYSVANQNVIIGKTLSNIQVTSAATGVNGEQVSGTLTWAESSGGSALPSSYAFTGAVGSTQTLYWTFAPTNGNYKALSGSTVFTLTEKEIPVLTVSNIEKTYDGKAVTTVTGTAKVGEAPVAGTFVFDGTPPTMQDAKTYNVTVKFIPTDSARYEVATISITVTIHKAAVEVATALSSTQIVAGDALPTASLRYDGLVNGESLIPATTATFSGMPRSSTQGTYTITWSNKAAMQAEIEALTAYKNYTASYKDSATLQISRKSGGGSTGGGSSGNNSSAGGGNITPPANSEPPSTAVTEAKISADQDGNVTAKVDDKDILNAIEEAQKAENQNGIAITLNVETKANTKSLAVTLSAMEMTALTNAKVTQFAINNGLTTTTLDLAALNALAGGDVKLTVSKADTTQLFKEAQAAIGNRPVFRFGATVGGTAVTDFKGGRVGLQMAYTPTTTEQAGNLCGVYVDANGKVSWLEASSYDPITGTMLISAQHFSTYGIGYKTNAPKFTDVGTHWAKNDIDFVVARGLLSGTSNTTFAPETGTTRGMFVTALGRLAGVDTKKYSTTKFTDVKADAYYSPYVAWANASNIVNGTSDTTFSPDKAITRQEMAVMLVNYSKTIGYKLPRVHAEVTFADAGSIGTWAKDAVGQVQMAGILTGKSGNRFDPTATATRAEVSAMLRRYVELVANTETAAGWSMNESGQWMYIEGGKRVTGKKTVDGKSYTFDQFGATTALSPELKYGTHTAQTGDSFWSIARKYKVSMLELAKANGKSIFSIIYAGDELKIPK